MIDADPFSQFIIVPDDQPVLPPVDEDVSGLKDLASIGYRSDLRIDQDDRPSGGLLLGSECCPNVPQGTDAFDMVALSPNGGENAFFLTSDSSPLYANLFPPALSPDLSPISVASSSWPQTPDTDLAHATVNLTPFNASWDIEDCLTFHFLDQSGYNLEDIPSQIQDVMPEDIACSPQIVPNGSLSISTAHTVPSNAPIFVISPPPGSTTQTDAMPFEQAHRTSPYISSPHTSQSLFGFSSLTQEPTLPARSLSLSLSPLSTISFFSQSPSASPNPSPFISCSPLSPAPPPVPLSNTDGKVKETDSDSSTPTTATPVKLRSKRKMDDEDEDAPTPKISRRSKAKNIDEEEWSPGSERAKRSRVASSSQSTKQMATAILHVESADYTTSRGSESSSDATPTTCRICGQGFTRASDYVRHVQNSASHPETRKVWPCPYCDSALGRKDALGRHIRTIHAGKPVLIPEGVLGTQLLEGQKEPLGRRIPLKQQPKKEMRRHG